MSYNYLNRNNSSIVQNNRTENKGLFNRLLRRISNFDMRYDDMIHRNSTAVGMNEDPTVHSSNLLDFFSQRAVNNVLSKKYIGYLDKAIGDKRRILREYSIKDEIETILTTLTDECIIYNEKRFCSAAPLSVEFSKEIHDRYLEVFNEIYYILEFSDGITAWQLMKDFLIDGAIAFEIVWDDKKKNIIHYHRLIPESLVPGYEPGIGPLWLQYPEDPTQRRIFLDSQIVYVSYSSHNDVTRISYLEGLIRPYNQLKLMEQTRIMFNINNASLQQQFTVPVNGLSPTRAEQAIGQMIADYSEEVEWDDTLGTVSINGSKHLPLNKAYWFPSSDKGNPEVSMLSPDGHDLNESDMLDWFYNNLKRASRLPDSRFDRDSGGGAIFSDSSEMTLDEVKFGQFVNRIRVAWKEIIVKGIKLQMMNDFPELIDNKQFLNTCDIIFNSNQIFEEWKKINNMEKKADAVNSLLSLERREGLPFFHIDYLMKHVYGITPEEEAENNSYWEKDRMSGVAPTGGANSDFGGSDEVDIDGGSFDDSMSDISADDFGDSSPDTSDEDFDF